MLSMEKLSLQMLKKLQNSILLADFFFPCTVYSGALKRNLSPEQVRADFVALGRSRDFAK